MLFLDTDTALREQPELFQEYFGTVIPVGDNKFAALNTSVWSGGSFIYVPKGVHVDIPLQAYFRINTENMGQFERTLIIVDEDAYVHYVEGCTAPIYSSDSLHSAVVEIIVKKGGRCRYTTIQNWSNNVYNLVTKRATCEAGATMEWVDGNIGSKVTMKYPAVYLMGEHARGETLSIAFAGEGQHQDAGAKMVHAAPNTSSSILSKSVARGGGRTSYRGLIQINEGAHGSKSNVLCDALLVDQISRSDTYPYVDIREDDVSMGHEASVSKVSDDQLFYLMSRGMEEDEAMAMIVRGFVEPIAKELPMEYALELNRLIELQMEGRGRLSAPARLRPPRPSRPPSTRPSRTTRKTICDCDRHCARQRGRLPRDGPGGLAPAPRGVLRPRRPPGPDRPRGDLALHAAQAAARPARRRRPLRHATSRSRSTCPTASSSRSSRPGTRCAAPAASCPATASRPGSGTRPDGATSSGSRPTPSSTGRSCVDVTGTGLAEVASATHVVVEAGRHSQATVVLRFRGSATLADITETVVGDGAQLTVVSIDDWDDDAVHTGHRHAQVGRDATFRHVDVSFGGDVVRHDSTTHYAGPGGSAEMLGLYFADAGQHIEHRLFVDHDQPRTNSHVVYKGALQGEGAHTVWIGNVLIRKVAEGIETYEENRNLVLTDGCQADSVPNLEIETGEIEGAGHASTAGRFDDEQLFYLRSRGISEHEARRLVVHGFFNDLIRKIAVPEIEEQLTRDRRGRAREERPEGPGVRGRRMSFERACALSEVPDDEALGVTVGVHGRRRRPRRRRGLRDPGPLLARRGRAQRGRGRGLHDRVLAARLALRPAHRQADRPARHRARRDLPRRGPREPRRHPPTSTSTPPPP